MKSTVVHLLMAALVLVWGACSIVDPFIIALDLPLDACASINDGTNWNETSTYDIRAEIARISTDYPDKVHATRVNDITVYMPNPPATGTGTGTVRFAFDGGSLTTLLTFTNLPFDSLRGSGISLRSRITNPGQVVFNSAGLTSLLNVLQDSTGLPHITTMTLSSSGFTSVNVSQGTGICARIHFQADAQIGGD
jgi:hypothetical protein